MNETSNLYRQAINALLRGIAYDEYKGNEAFVVTGAVKILTEAYNQDPDVFVEEADDDGGN